MQTPQLSVQEFAQFQRLIHQVAGISLSSAKMALVTGRLAKRLKHHGLSSFGEYYRLVSGAGQAGELQIMVDLLTTNETYFFREPKHFDFLKQHAAAHAGGGRPFRVWSAASSSGEEAYSIAMTLAECLGDAPWEVLGSDISTRVLERARAGQYPLERARHIPEAWLRKYCLKGVRSQAGTFLIDQRLRSRVRFVQVNLTAPLPNLGEFDVIFLRNVMIYFDTETKRQVVQRMLPLLRPGGCFLVGHSESLHGISDGLQSVRAAIYRKPR
ncbi:MAG: CheR family methyltransferase [Pseudomonadota bacterium]|uniref:CheR family methyltransferase n=1 Tax=Thermithiobacillus tepidarius TaxID=929 RepID=UPI000407B1FE|nr:protein-glutamate O-methyltransferase CheR [Thermithiobacillus tepidarius]